MIHICPIEIAAVLGMVPVIPYLMARLRTLAMRQGEQASNHK